MIELLLMGLIGMLGVMDLLNLGELACGPVPHKGIRQK